VFSRRFIGEDFIFRSEKRGHFLWHVGGIGRFLLSWAHPPFSCCVWSIVAEFAPFQVVVPWLGVIFIVVPAVILLVAACYLLLAVFSPYRGCVFFPGAAWEAKGRLLLVDLHCWLYLHEKRGSITELGLPYHSNQTAEQ
jgi:hypothetical protein